MLLHLGSILIARCYLELSTQGKGILINPNLKQQNCNFARAHKLHTLILSGSKAWPLYATACYLCYLIYGKLIVNLSIVNFNPFCIRI